MHDSAWMKLLRHIPASEQSKLMLVTTGGTEITIQNLLRIDPECLALRGRLAGSTDAGRVFFVPYANIAYFGFQQPLKESEFRELFDSLSELSADTPLDSSSAPGGTSPETAAPPPALANRTTARDPSVIKSTVLEKFRARSVSSQGTQIRPQLEE